MSKEMVKIDKIKAPSMMDGRVDPTDIRVQMHVESIRKCENGSWPLGNLEVFYDGQDYWLVDGFLRITAAKLEGRTKVPCIVHKGSDTEAWEHRFLGPPKSLPLTMADRKGIVNWLLDRPEKYTQKEISEISGVSRSTVGKILSKRKAAAAVAEADRGDCRRGNTDRSENKAQVDAEDQEITDPAMGT